MNRELDAKNVKVVDTTCPWVAKVWNTVHTHQVRGLTSVIHGKYGHEETMATKSMCETYICVKNLDEAEYLADFMINAKEGVVEQKSLWKILQRPVALILIPTHIY